MSTTPRSAAGDSLNGSWEEINGFGESRLLGTPLHALMESKGSSFRTIEKLLWEAQKESNRSSATGSGPGSHSISPVTPQSPVYAEDHVSCVEAMLMNKEELMERSRQLSTDWIWDWTARPDLCETRNDIPGYEPVKKPRLSLRQWAVRRGLFSKEMLSLLLLTNLLSLLLGAGIGYTVLVRRPL